ncbi:MAG: HAD-IIIA family hydrolase [Rikenellaceae bacterium]|nr:HAD-IIIA family hydrolase [Rikenellaceae bacterium]
MKIDKIDITGYDTLLLDRDGTINVHIIDDYVRKWNDFEFIPHALDTIVFWSTQVKHIFIVTNQRGIQKGKYTIKDLEDIHAHMIAKIEKAGGFIDKIYYCSSLTEDDVRRKPGRGMFDDILRDYPDVEPCKTLMIGDSDVDRDFAKNCGIDFVRIDSLKRKGSLKYWVNN